MRGHDESADSRNPGIFKGLINFTSTLDEILKEHLKTATVFQGRSKDIQNDLLECMLEVCHDKIREEISAADFVSIIADETTDISTQFQLSTIIRYVLKNGKPVERFWSFVNPVGHDAVSLTSSIKNVLIETIGENRDKLISQSYDGASVMSGRQSGVQTLIKNEYPNAYFVHCYAHQLTPSCLKQLVQILMSGYFLLM